jgi:nucleoside-diphosphate-sugar epimerase
VLAEETTNEQAQRYTWRLRRPFNEADDRSNFLSHLIDSPCVRDGLNSLSHLDDCVRACLDLWNQRAPFGTYNLINPGAVTTQEIIGMIHSILKPPQRFQRVSEHGGLAHEAQDGPPDCILDSSKLATAGIRIRPVRQALEHSLRRWQPRLIGMARALA